jgi:hypothetical protein
MTADMLRVTADLNDRDDTAINDRFKGENREVLEQMRHAERDGARPSSTASATATANCANSRNGRRDPTPPGEMPG